MRCHAGCGRGLHQMPQNGKKQPLLIGGIERSSGHINDYLLNLGSGRLFQLLPEPFHGEHLQTPDRLPQGEISLFQDIRFNWNKRAHSDTEYLKQYFLSRIFGLTRSGPCWTTCTMERYTKCRYIMG